MGEAVNEVQHEFWRPPVKATTSDAVTNQEPTKTCADCGTEFIVGSRFCHSCGSARRETAPAFVTLEIPGLAELSALGRWFGLTAGPFVAFVLGICCLLGALGVGVVFGAKTMLDWQAIQLWRIEWLLGAIAAFAAGTLLKKPRSL